MSQGQGRRELVDEDDDAQEGTAHQRLIHLVHGPHAAGLSRRGRLWVYVRADTGTWGLPVRLGTKPELTLLRLVAAN